MSDVPASSEPSGDQNPFEVAEAMVEASRQVRYLRDVDGLRTQLFERLAYFEVIGALSNIAVFRSDDRLTDILVMTQRDEEASFMQPPLVRIFRSQEVATPLPLGPTFVYEDATIHPDGETQHFVDALILNPDTSINAPLPVTPYFYIDEETGGLAVKRYKNESPVYQVVAKGTEKYGTVIPSGLPSCPADQEYALERTQTVVDEISEMQIIFSQMRHYPEA